MPRKLDFDNSKSSKLINRVMEKVDTDQDNKKRDIDINLIDMNEDNEKIFGLDDIDYLAANIKEDGFSGAIEVYALDNGRYEISSGHRRFLAAKDAGMEKIPAIVTEHVDDKTKAKKLIKSNILNRKLTPFMTAKALEYYKANVLYDYPGDKMTELCRVFNLSETSAKRIMKLLKLAPELQKYANEVNVSYTNLIPLTKHPHDIQLKVYEELRKMYPEAENVFVSASAIVIEQKVNLVLGWEENRTTKIMPTEQQVRNRAEAFAENGDDDDIPVPSEVPTFENTVMDGSYNAGEESSDASRDDDMINPDDVANELREAQVIDRQMTVFIGNIKRLVSGNYTITDESVKENFISDLEAIIERLKNS